MSDNGNENEEGPRFQVRDKRRVSLDPEKDEKTEDTTEAGKADDTSTDQEKDVGQGPSKEDMEAAKNLADAAAKGDRPPPEADFTTFVISLASSAILHLGQAPHPETSKVETNLPMAKQVIDMLSMLKEKTKGNLEPDEGRYLEAILYDLRLRFVEASQKESKPPSN